MRPDPSGWQTRIDQAMVEHYRATGAWSGVTIHEAAWTRAAERPDAIALYPDGEAPVTFGAVARDARRAARAMAGLGLKPGDVLSFILPNWPEAAAINIAASALGLVVNPIIPIYREAECVHIMSEARTRILFIPGSFRGFDYAAMVARLRPDLPDLRHVVLVRPDGPTALDYPSLLARGEDHEIDWPIVDPDAVKLVLYTSGTTGKAKGVLHTHNTIGGSRQGAVHYWGLTSADIALMPSPVTHITGYSFGLEMPFLEGVKSVLMVRWNAEQAVTRINETGATFTVGATPFLQELIEAAERAEDRLDSLRFFACGGAAVPPDLIHRGNQWFRRCRCFRMYGSTEAPAVTRGWMGGDEATLAAVTDGKIVDWDVQVLDPAGRPVEPGQEGEFAVRGPALTAGYVVPRQNDDNFTASGYFLTGDLGIVTPEGGLLVTGRKKDLIIRGGENLSPKEIEDVLHTCPMIREAAVVAMPHARLGEGICAFVIARDPAEPPTHEAVAAFVTAAGLARQKIPERVEVLGDFPRTASGKIRKDILRAMAKEIVGSL